MLMPKFIIFAYVFTGKRSQIICSRSLVCNLWVPTGCRGIEYSDKIYKLGAVKVYSYNVAKQVSWGFSSVKIDTKFS